MNDYDHEPGPEFAVRIAQEDVERRREVMARLVGADPAGPLDPRRPTWRTNSYALSVNCSELVNSYFVLAGWSLRRSSVVEALEYLAAAQQPIEVGHAVLRAGIHLDHGGGVERSDWHPALLLPDGYCRLFLDRPTPPWIGSFSGEESVRQVDPQAKGSVGCGVVLHSLRSLWRGDAELARSLATAAGGVSRTAHRRERGLLSWMLQAPRTALASIEAGEKEAATALRAQIDRFKELDKPEPGAVDTWIAQVGNDTHRALSIDWFAAACCKLRPSLTPSIRGYSPFLWIPHVS